MWGERTSWERASYFLKNGGGHSSSNDSEFGGYRCVESGTFGMPRSVSDVVISFQTLCWPFDDQSIPHWNHALMSLIAFVLVFVLRFSYSSFVQAEVQSCRENVAVFDMTSFSKYSVGGRDAAQVLQRLCCANVDVDVGTIVYTGMLNDRGGYEADVTVTRLADDEFSVISATAQATRDMHWMKGRLSTTMRFSRC
mgnify:CR=1 FL=1